MDSQSMVVDEVTLEELAQVRPKISQSVQCQLLCGGGGGRAGRGGEGVIIIRMERSKGAL
jgi:hypothetical protein